MAELKLWKVFASAMAACLVTLVSSAFWFGGQAEEIKQQRIALGEVVIRVNRIDFEGSYALSKTTPFTIKEIERLQAEVSSLKASAEKLSLAVARLNVLMDTQNRILKDNNP